MSGLRTLRRRGYTAALVAFRKSPPPLRRAAVRAVTPGFTVGAVAAIEHGDRILFLRQPHRDGWSLPGGLLDRRERAADAVVREVYEETGLRIRVGIPLTCQVNARVRRVDVIFRVAVDAEPRVTVGGEAKDHRWLRLEDVADADASTREILALLERDRDPAAVMGRLAHGA